MQCLDQLRHIGPLLPIRSSRHLPNSLTYILVNFIEIYRGSDSTPTPMSSYQITKDDAERAAAKMKSTRKPTKPKNMFLRFSVAERSNIKLWLSQHHTVDMIKMGTDVPGAKDVAYELGRRWKSLTKESTLDMHV